MRSNNLRYNPALDHVRFLAAGLVFCFHLFHVHVGGYRPLPGRPLLGLLVEGHTGVSLFFVLSGFLFMSIAATGGPIAYGAFLFNRAVRILPLYLFLFFVAISIDRDRFVGADAFYLLFSNLGHAPTSASAVTGAAWTISVEFAFYLAFPFLARFALERGLGYLPRLLLLMAVVRVAAYGAAERPTAMFFSTLVGRFDQFLVGMLAGQLWHRVRPGPAASRLAFGLGAGAIFGAVAYQARHASLFAPGRDDPFWIGWGMVEAGCWAMLVAGYSSSRIALPRPVAGVLERGGRMSYSIYLFHLMVITVLQKNLGTLCRDRGTAVVLLVNGAIALAVTWVVAAVSYDAIEAPFLAMRRRYVRVADTTAG